MMSSFGINHSCEISSLSQLLDLRAMCNARLDTRRSRQTYSPTDSFLDVDESSVSSLRNFSLYQSVCSLFLQHQHTPSNKTLPGSELGSFF
ncbi:hypothetical protein HanRHA438_Chr09g0409831 [Helianthus annuus]|nr:hypothetical protein HanRHA438_Chr09g0409831 [Helianthus annuus]